jgi:1-phosphatidylinositol phosphodiesterase
MLRFHLCGEHARTIGEHRYGCTGNGERGMLHLGHERALRSHWLVLLGVALMVSTLMTALGAPSAQAHEDGAYRNDRDSSSVGTDRSDWMAPLPETLRLSDLSLPGTHDSGAYRFGRETTETQAMSIDSQLKAGIRVLDLRVGQNGVCSLHIFHGGICQLQDDASAGGGALKFSDVVDTLKSFLAAHPGETIVVRLKKETGNPDFDKIKDLLSGSYYDGTSTNPTLKDMRGKMVLLVNDFSALGPMKWNGAGQDIQDEYDLGDNWDLATKWRSHVIPQLNEADAVRTNSTARDTIFINFLSAANGGFPYFFASGHSSWETRAPRLLTGWTRGPGGTCGGAEQCLREYPSVNCAGELCSVAFEGINILARDYIRHSVKDHTGIVMADFPGSELIGEIVAMNPWNWPPDPEAGGPYTAEENKPVTFDASGSTDKDGDRLQYRWDVDSDGTFEREWSDDPEYSYTWKDDHAGTATVEVTDEIATTTDTTQVSVTNVDPVVAVGEALDETGASVLDEARPVLTGLVVGVKAPFSDQGPLDTHTATIDWRDDTEDLGAVTSPLSASHTWTDAGTYPVTVSVTDDDGGTGTDATTIQVLDASGAAEAVVKQLQDLIADEATSDEVSTLLQSAVGDLIGNNGGRAKNGMVDKLAQGNDNAALVKIEHAVKHVQGAEDAGGPDTSGLQSLLALSAKSTVVGLIGEAESAGDSPRTARALKTARAEMDGGDAAMSKQQWLTAVERYRAAVRAVAPLV